MAVNVSAARAVAALLVKCGLAMRSNAAYVRSELPKLTVVKDIGKEICSVCDLLDRNGTECINEGHEFGEFVDQGRVVDRLVATAKRILSNIHEDLQRIDVLVKRLDAKAEPASDSGLAYLLVAESAVDIYKAYSAAADAAKHLDE